MAADVATSRFKAAIIGGSGFDAALDQVKATAIHVPTRFGWLRASAFERDGSHVLLVKRHSLGHKLAPEFVNYRAIAAGLAQLGVSVCFSTAAVGSLRTDWGPGSLAICEDFIDVSARHSTLFETSVQHTDVSRAFDPGLTTLLGEIAPDAKIGATYVTTNGPRYETPAEIKAYRELGGEVVGMTVGTEAAAMAEAGIPYACLAIVTNYAAGMGEGVLSHEEVLDVMSTTGKRVWDVLMAAVDKLD